MKESVPAAPLKFEDEATFAVPLGPTETSLIVYLSSPGAALDNKVN